MGNITQRPDFLFAGMGPQSSIDNKSYFEASIQQTEATIESNFSGIALWDLAWAFDGFVLTLVAVR